MKIIKRIKMKRFLFLLSLFYSLSISAQESDRYNEAYNYINKMLAGEEELSFVNAVFITENAYCDELLDIDNLKSEFKILMKILKFISTSELITYTGKDKEEMTKHAAIFRVMTDTVSIILDSVNTLMHLPYTYDFEDVTGQSDWTKMFVSKLMLTGSGNCHSLPYLYKILADELGIPCYLAFAPNHIYIKTYSQTAGWYNTELTSATFPVDAWIIASGYVNTDAIRNGLYMDTLSNKQAVANCMLDLAHGYQRKYGNENAEFVIKCCNTVLQYHPTNINAMLTKAEAQKNYIQLLMKSKNIKNAEELFTDSPIKMMYEEMEETYIRLHRSGYRRMPEEMYLQWMGLLKTEPSKYIDKNH
jgi:hypothetical protein